MPFSVRTETQPGVPDRDPTVYILEEGLTGQLIAGPTQVEPAGQARIWPALGFNCYHWQVTKALRPLYLLYCAQDLFTGGRPTRSGIPILFPFPNRIRAGHFTWDGKEYRLPLNGPAGKNAIHGFACRTPWRVVDHGSDARSAWVTGAFRGSTDAPEARGMWPADYELRVTYRLGENRLRIEAEVHNPDTRPLPFGLGYHPYFRVPFSAEAKAEECLVTVPARACWVLDEGLPTGERRFPDAARDLNSLRRYGELHLDDILTDLPAERAAADGLYERGLIQGAPDAALRLLCSAEFRDMVVFTPPHREAFCIEPYTCTTDAVNLQQRGAEAGWLTLAPGGRWTSTVEMQVV